eukprot:CAMPEP_0173131698 /NCGR_PEP_ID=MMETSP1102-20130122/60790_1 /TAXON_ID=49646 /ORGANISM="Geminigera sp., Strain Caron Lab Isolate" /LENGTH=75 /DNA_ID=CAMNT_0014043053 /DNA_START=706 /DNA_END=930 /DNA_ORIENTATION=-
MRREGGTYLPDGPDGVGESEPLFVSWSRRESRVAPAPSLKRPPASPPRSPPPPKPPPPRLSPPMSLLPPLGGPSR